MKKRNTGTPEKILEAGVKLWKKNPEKVTARGIADEIGMTHGAVLYHFDDVKDAVAKHAVKTGESKIIAQLVLANHPAIHRMSKAKRSNHLSAAMR